MGWVKRLSLEESFVPHRVPATARWAYEILEGSDDRLDPFPNLFRWETGSLDKSNRRWAQEWFARHRRALELPDLTVISVSSFSDSMHAIWNAGGGDLQEAPLVYLAHDGSSHVVAPDLPGFFEILCGGHKHDPASGALVRFAVDDEVYDNELREFTRALQAHLGRELRAPSEIFAAAQRAFAGLWSVQLAA